MSNNILSRSSISDADISDDCAHRRLIDRFEGEIIPQPALDEGRHYVGWELETPAHILGYDYVGRHRAEELAVSA